MKHVPLHAAMFIVQHQRCQLKKVSLQGYFIYLFVCLFAVDPLRTALRLFPLVRALLSPVFPSMSRTELQRTRLSATVYTKNKMLWIKGEQRWLVDVTRHTGDGFFLSTPVLRHAPPTLGLAMESRLRKSRVVNSNGLGSDHESKSRNPLPRLRVGVFFLFFFFFTCPGVVLRCRVVNRSTRFSSISHLPLH